MSAGSAKTRVAEPAEKKARFSVRSSVSGRILMKEMREGAVLGSGGIVMKKKRTPSAAKTKFKLTISEETAAQQVSITKDIARLNLK